MADHASHIDMTREFRIQNAAGEVVWSGDSEVEAARWWFENGRAGDDLNGPAHGGGVRSEPMFELASQLFPYQAFTYTEAGEVSTPNGRLDDERS